MRKAAATTLIAVALAASPSGSLAGDPWLDRVRAFEPGTSAGFGADSMPGIVLGGPEGLGESQGSYDVVSLGNAGTIVVSFDDNAVVDGPGDDLVVFENPFVAGSLLFEELAFVEVSADGSTWVEFPWDAGTKSGLAGREPVYASSLNAWDPLHPASGGDRYDLADVGLDYVRFLRITDAGALLDDPGNHVLPAGKGGFDLDAAAAIHSVDLGCVWGFVTVGGLPVGGVRVRLREAGGEEKRVRRTRPNGKYRFCRLRPDRDYDLDAAKAGVGQDLERVFVDERQLKPRLDLVLP